MKRFYVPKGETLELAELHTELVIVDGFLKVSGSLTAKHIQGKGYIETEEILCDTSTISCARAEIVTAQKIVAHTLMVRDCRADEIAVTDYLEALCVQADRLTMSRSRLEHCDVKEIILLPQKKRGILGTLLAAWWRSLWISKKPPHKAEKVRTDTPQNSEETQPKPDELPPSLLTPEFLNALVTELETQGFQRKHPATPQVLDFGKEEAA